MARRRQSKKMSAIQSFLELLRQKRGSSAGLARTLTLEEAKYPSHLEIELPAPLRKRYDVQRVVGSGGFGLVVLAADRTLGRMVAVKQLYPHLQSRPQVCRRFLQEARIAGALSHPNIVTIYTVEQATDSGCCVVMEYLGGGNLGEMIREASDPLPLNVVLSITLGVLEGLRAAHLLGVVHRDMKPENILFDNLGNPKISDFGLAHLPTEAGGIDETGLSNMGTPIYMAPELFEREVTFQPAGDLYAVGLILFEMLTGRRIGDLPCVRRLAEFGAYERIPDSLPLELIADDTPPAVKDILIQMLHEHPARRPATADEVIRVLHPHLMESVAGRRSGIHTGDAFAVSNLDILRDILELLLTDGVLGPSERLELDRRIERLGIGPDIAFSIEEEVRRRRGLPSRFSIQEFSEHASSVSRTG